MTLLATLMILLPRPKGWTFVLDATIILNDWKGKDEQELQGFLATSLSGHYKKNEQLLDRLFYWFVVAGLGLAAEVVFWIIQLATA